MITRYIKQPEFGDTWLQDKINKESFEAITEYYEKFAAVTGESRLNAPYIEQSTSAANKVLAQVAAGSSLGI